jgi:2-iminobutanoate/2-iminopropanoate deaminase
MIGATFTPPTMRRRLSLLLMTSLFGACARPNALEVEWLPAPRPTAPFAEAVRVGDILYLSGQIGADSAGRLVPGGLQAEARQALNNIKSTLEKHGSGLDRVVKCTVFLADIRDYNDFNEIYLTYFRARRPARSAMAASGLALNARVEIECIAVT